MKDAAPGTGFLAEVAKDLEMEVFRAKTYGLTSCGHPQRLILGRGGALDKLLPLYKLGLGVVFGSGLQYWSWIHLKDAVDLFAWLYARKVRRGRLTAVRPIRSPKVSSAGASEPKPAFIIHAPSWVCVGYWETRLLR